MNFQMLSSLQYTYITMQLYTGWRQAHSLPYLSLLLYFLKLLHTWFLMPPPPQVCSLHLICSPLVVASHGGLSLVSGHCFFVLFSIQLHCDIQTGHINVNLVKQDKIEVQVTFIFFVYALPHSAPAARQVYSCSNNITVSTVVYCSGSRSKDRTIEKIRISVVIKSFQTWVSDWDLSFGRETLV